MVALCTDGRVNCWSEPHLPNRPPIQVKPLGKAKNAGSC